MKIKGLLTTIFLILISAPGFTQTTGKLILGKGYKGFILQVDVRLELDLNGLLRWMPSEKDIEELEKLLPTFFNIKKSLTNYETATYPLIKKKLPEYFRQYVGYINKNGQKMIFVNCVDDYEKYKTSSYKNADKELMDMRDGGISIWKINYHIEKRKFSEFTPNGEA